MQPNTKYLKRFYKAIEMFYPSILEEVKPRLILPVPVLTHLFLLPALLIRFCQLKGVEAAEIWEGSESVHLKTLFIVVVIDLYNPHPRESMKPKLVTELSGLLQTTKEFVNQAIEKAKAYEDEANQISNVLEKEFNSR
jgi:hypothetical protein